MAGSIIDPSPAATILETQRKGYNGTTLTTWDTTEPQIIGNFEIAGSIAEYASAESITNWSALSNGTVYIKNIPDSPSTGDVSAQFTDVAPTWDETKMGWYGTGANADHRYLFKLTKTGASGYAEKQFLETDGKYNNIDIVDELTVGGALTAATVNTGNGATEIYDMDQDVKTTDAVVFATVNTGQGANELYAMNQAVRTTDNVQHAIITASNYFNGPRAASIRTYSSATAESLVYSELSAKWAANTTYMANGYFGSLDIIGGQRSGSAVIVYFNDSTSKTFTNVATTIGQNMRIFY